MVEHPAIRVKELSKSFRLPHEQHSGVKQLLINFYRRNAGYETQHVLDDISFEISKGEFFGIVGRNGSGKSTLLKLLAGIYAPDKGLVQVDGSLTPFIELGVGFNPELTGRENIFLNGALLGFGRDEMSAMYDEIVEFAELQRFMDQKLKNYSSGMQVRLAFSIAIRARSDILVMDEVLAVGDAVFQKKCFEVFRELKKQGRTIILVTHDMGNVEKFCDRVLVLDKGKILAITGPHEASMLYAQLNVSGGGQASKVAITQKRWGSGGVTIKDPHIKPNDTDKGNVYEVGDDLEIAMTIERDPTHKKVPVLIGLAFHNQDDVVVYGPNSKGKFIGPHISQVTFKAPNIPFAPGDYKITVAAFDEEGNDAYDFLDKHLSFTVISDHAINGIVDLNAKWELG